jgi:hypothetical protein
MAMKVYGLKCPACGYESKHLLGTPDADQILTDVNTEFAQYRLFVCEKEKKFVHADILDFNFDKKCPSDGSELEEVDPKTARCPRCGGNLDVQESRPLAATDSSAE